MAARPAAPPPERPDCADAWTSWRHRTSRAGGSFHGAVPARVFDTRDGTGGVAVAPVGPDTPLVIDVTGVNGVRTSA